MTLRLLTLTFAGALTLTACGGDKTSDTEPTDSDAQDDEDDQDDESDSEEPTDTDEPTESEGEDTELLLLIGYYGLDGTVTLEESTEPDTGCDSGDTGDCLKTIVEASFEGYYTTRFNNYLDSTDYCVSYVAASGVPTSYECDDCEWQMEISFTGVAETQDEIRGVCEYFQPNGEEVEAFSDPLIVGWFPSYSSGYYSYGSVMLTYYETYGWYMPGATYFQYYWGTRYFDEESGDFQWEIFSHYGYYYY